MLNHKELPSLPIALHDILNSIEILQATISLHVPHQILKADNNIWSGLEAQTPYYRSLVLEALKVFED